MKVFIEIRGGNFVECYSDSDDLEVVLVDWDNLENEGEVGPVPLRPTSEMPLETLSVVKPIR